MFNTISMHPNSFSKTSAIIPTPLSASFHSFIGTVMKMDSNMSVMLAHISANVRLRKNVMIVARSVSQ